ncbi:MAG: hypothetical protein QHH14_09905 [Clostridiales bacterium]|nr:hypothetical protein [Clostridiales bacterium]
MKNKWGIPAVVLSCLALISPSPAQEFFYYPYYGKNKIMYEDFQWKSYATDHFHVYFYAERPEVLKNVAEVAESAYHKISDILKHQLTDPVPIIYYTTYTDFEQSNLFNISEGVLGVSEPLLHRIGVHGDMPLDELQSLVEHELTHIFQFDILWGRPGASLYALSTPPLWLFEGLSEYTTGRWTSWSQMLIRDAVLNDRIPEITDSGDLYSRYPMPRDPAYDFGHAIYDFIEEKYGHNGIKELWQSLKNSPLIGRIAPLKKAFNIKPHEFNYEFKKFLREKNRKFLIRENPEDYSIALGPKFPQNPYYFTFSHAVSPSGDLIAALTYNVAEYDIDLVLISTKDGSIVKNITRGFTTDYDYIKYEYDPSQGASLAWSPDGDTIVFFARHERRYSLYFVDVLRGKLVRKINIPYDRPAAPCFSPGGKAIYFTAFAKGWHDIFRLDLETEGIDNLTQDSLFEKAPAVSPDGRYLAYSIRVDAADKLFLSPLDNMKQKTQLTFGQGNTICPAFAASSKDIFFSGDAREAINIYSINVETGELKRFTDVWTGNFYPVPHPRDPNRIVFSAFNKGSYQIFLAELKGLVEDRMAFAELPKEESLPGFRPSVSLDINQDKIEPYKGMQSLYVSGRPPVDVLVSSDGSVFGGTAISFGDILGDHNFYAMFFQSRGLRSYYFAYINQKKRLQFMPSLFEYTLYYYLPYSYFDSSLYYSLSYQDAIAYRKISSANITAFYPLNRYYRLEGNFGFYRYEENFANPYSMGMYTGNRYGYFWNGNALSLSLAITGETTHFNPYFGPLAGHTFRISLTQGLPVSESFFRNTTVQADMRKYFYFGAASLLALRFEGWASRGRDPYVFYHGGNNQVRSSYYYNIVSTEGWFFNAELRFPLVNAASTILGQIGPVRGALFFDITRAKLDGYPAKFYEYYGPGVSRRSFDALGSYGYGIQFFLFGLPLHIEFAKRLNWPDISRPLDVQGYGGFETKFWIGFDF